MGFRKTTRRSLSGASRCSSCPRGKTSRGRMLPPKTSQGSCRCVRKCCRAVRGGCRTESFECHYLLARTYHQVGDVPRRNACATKFRQISEFLDGSGRCQSSSWESLGLSAAKRPVDAASDEAFKSNIDMPSSKPSYIPSTPPSWGVGTSPNGRVSARPAGTLGGSNAVGSALMGGAFGEVSPFTYAFDAAEAAAAATAVSARDGDVGCSQDATALDPRQGRCPALAQLLAVAEAAGQDGAHASSTTALAKQGQPPGSLIGLLPPVGGATCGMKTVIGTICSPYPTAAVLAARD